MTLHNRGRESYSPEAYGNKVIVHRIIRDNGTSTYKIKGTDGMYYTCIYTCACVCLQFLHFYVPIVGISGFHLDIDSRDGKILGISDGKA